MDSEQAESVPARDHLSNSIGRIRSTPRLIVLGFATAMGAAWLVLLSPVVFEATRGIAQTLLVAAGQGQVGAYEMTMSRVTTATVQTVLAVPGTLVALSLVWMLAGVVGGAVVRPSATGPGDRLSRDELVRVLTCGLGRRAAGVPVWIAAWATLLGVYFGVGTLVEATGYALGLYDPLPAVVPTVMLLATVAGACAVTVAVVGFVDTAVLSGVEGGLGSLLAGTFSYALDYPRRVARHSAVLAVLLGAPFVVPVALLGATFGPGSPASQYVLMGAAGSVILVGTVTYTLSAVYRAEVFETEVGPALAGGDAAGVRGRVPWGRVALVALVVAGLVVGGGAVRAAGIAPDGPGAAPAPGPVDGDDPREEIEAGIAALDETEYRIQMRTYRTNASGNGSIPDEWNDYPAMVVDRRIVPGEATRIDGMVGNGGPANRNRTYTQSSVYATRTETAIGGASVEAGDRAELATDTVEWKRSGTILPHHYRSLGIGVGEPLDWLSPTAEWERVETTDDAVVFRAEGLESIVTEDGLGSQSSMDPNFVERARAFVRLDRETGVVRAVRYEVVQSFEHEGEKKRTPIREVYTVEGHGDADLSRPDGVSRGPLGILVSAIFY